ncbi:MAG: EamA family transporter, partial [Euryarchaeota archaeon]|nr:EamA family transporter [Euryarchaeota archaeon]
AHNLANETRKKRGGDCVFALSTPDVSFVYPLLSLGYVITAILAFVFLKETITMERWCGIFLVVVGCCLIIRTV